MKHPEINEILSSYTAGEIDFETANKQLEKANSKVYLNPEKNFISDEERYTHGLLDTGTGSLDKVKVINGERLEHAVNEVNSDGSVNMLAYVIFNGNRYSVFGDLLVKIEED